MSRTTTALLAIVLVATVCPMALGAQVLKSPPPKKCNPVITRSQKTITVDPFIVPSLNESSGLLPAGVCGFSGYPNVSASCTDTLVFVLRAVPAGFRVHGVYLLEDDFVDQKTGAYRCPSPATDIDLRNATDGFGNPGRCRGDTMTSVTIDGTTNFTAPFKASSECSGYLTIDELDVFTPNVTAGCSAPFLKASMCYNVTKVTVPLASYVKKGQTKWLVFSCPNISGGQPGKPRSHCMDNMTVPVKVTC